jgi:hypothetical protein
MHKIRRETFNDTYVVQESFLPTDRTLLRIAATGGALSMHAMCLNMVALLPSTFRSIQRLAWVSCLPENYM